MRKHAQILNSIFYRISNFELQVHKADAVAVIVGSQWYYLKSDSDSGNKTWQGIAFTGRDPEATAEVYARYSANKTDFFPLLQYKLVEED